LLEGFGFNADAVANGAEAVKALEMIPHNIVLMDIQMPEMDGLEATKMIRDTHSKVINHNVIIVAMTAHAMSGDRQKCLDAGMNEYISKPINTEELFEIINRHVSTIHKVGKISLNLSGAENGGPPNKVLEGQTVFDRDELLQRAFGDEDFCNELVNDFSIDTPDYLERLQQAVENEDTIAAAKEAHTLKGASANIGAHALRAAAFEMEKAANAEDSDLLRGLMTQIKREFEAFLMATSQD